MDKIYCKVPKTLYATEFLRKGFSAKRNTIPGKFVETFYDEECTKRQCVVARRTFEDLYVIVKTYYPKYTKSNVAKMIKTLHEKDNVFPIWCNAQDKIVFYKKSTSAKGLAINHFIQDEDWDDNGNGEYSWNDIVKLMK